MEQKKSFVLPLTIILGVLVIILAGFLIKFFGTKSLVKNTLSEAKPTEAVKIWPTPTKIMATPLPVRTTPDEKIVKAVVNNDCQIEVTTSKGQKFYEDTEYREVGATTMCKNTPIGKISVSGKYLAYGGSSGGVDQWYGVFALPYGKSFTLGVWGTSSVMEDMWLPEDQLALIDGYPDIYDEQSLLLFNISEIFKDYQRNFALDTLYLMTRNPTLDPQIQLPNAGTNHKKLIFINGMIQTRDEKGTMLVQYKLEDMWESGSVYGINAKMVKLMVFQWEEKYVKSQDSWDLIQEVDLEKSDQNSWIINTVDKKTKNILRSYQVDTKTGEITKL